LAEELEFTGERFTPECVREIRYEHLHRYAFAVELVRGRAVLDAACGEGYGSALLAAAAERVTGVDRSPEAVAHARDRYRLPNLSFEAADCLQLPFGDDAFDGVVSFETLEHLDDHDGLLREFRRVLKPGGFLLISSPDKAVYSERLQNRNPFHVRELYRDELEALLGRHFPACRLWGQKLGFHSAIWSLDGKPGVRFEQEDGEGMRQAPAPRHELALRHNPAPPHDPVYFIALCAASEADLPEPGAGLSLFDDAGETVYAHYHHEIRKNMAAGEILAERERELAERERRHERELAALRAELAQARAAKRPRPRPWWRRLFGDG
jgi:SAM-dependent methyltransferase